MMDTRGNKEWIEEFRLTEDLRKKRAWLKLHGLITGGGWNSDTGMSHSIWSSFHTGWRITGYGSNDSDVDRDLYDSIKNHLYKQCVQYEHQG